MADDQNIAPARSDYTVTKGKVSLAVYRHQLWHVVRAFLSMPARSDL